MKALFEKWFCRHKWKTHFSKQVTIETHLSDENKKTFGLDCTHRRFIREVLICENCGKIKIIEY